MTDCFIPRRSEEDSEEYIYRLGSLKENKLINLTWQDLSLIFNENITDRENKGESGWRKLYYKIKAKKLSNIELVEENNEKPETSENIDKGLKKFFNEVSKEKIKIRNERNSIQKNLREEADNDQLLDLFKTYIQKYNEEPVEIKINHICSDDEKVICILLSDIHYGLTFDNSIGKYNSEIAKNRLIKYAEEIIRNNNKNDSIYLSLMGDLISGNIHNTIRIENKENIVDQIIGVSELISEFIRILRDNFKQVFISTVNGNHSRITNLEDSIRDERLDYITYWYCKEKCNFDNVKFINNEIDSSISAMTIFDKTYIFVHGDMDNNLQNNKIAYENLLKKKIECIFSAHLHVPEIKYNNTYYIRNGSVCGSGDDYTIKKRLFSPPIQIYTIITKDGIKSIHPVNLERY